ncbi:MAG: CTP synthase [Pseudomonadota bacterium]|nr:CTP synthase [Pseudomonadota bacterium]
MKFIFITGGVVSSLGKGITAGSLGALLESCGYRVTCMKLDPYINIDPGTLSPSEHGEVYVTEDGYETDLDLGHYERFLSVSLKGEDNYVTSGQVYAEVIRKERRGDYLGKTIQVIPHITDHIQYLIESCGQSYDITLVEVGGTVGDIESLPFLESIRQMRVKHGYDNVMFVHLTFLPYVKTAGEMKTKPTQHSVKELRSIGIQPDILVCRAEHEISDFAKSKIGLFTNVKQERVIAIPDVNSIYQLPHLLYQQNFHRIVMKQFGMAERNPSLDQWQSLVRTQQSAKHTVKIAIVGKYTESKDAYKSLHEALSHAGMHLNLNVDICYVNSESLTVSSIESEHYDAILVPGGFGERGSDGKIDIIRWARENSIPFFGICFGMQLAVVEFFQNVLGLEGANSTELDPHCKDPVICLIDELKDKGDAIADLGGSMRLGAVTDDLVKDSNAHRVYGARKISERHRHRFEFNPKYIPMLEGSDLKISALSEKDEFVDMVELVDHPWFIACQFHPEFTSKPLSAHPLFISFLEAARKAQASRR